MVLPVLAISQTRYEYQGGIGNEWSNPFVWFPQNIPGETDTAYVPSGEVVIDSTFIVAKLILNGGNVSGDDTLKVIDNFFLENSILKGSTVIILGNLAYSSIQTTGFKQIAEDFTLINNGHIDWPSGKFSNSGNGGKLINNGSMSIRTSSRIFDNGNFENNGSISFDGSSKATIFTNFVNNGQVSVTSGHLEIGQNTGTAVDSGQYSANPGAILEFGFGSGERIFSVNSVIEALSSQVIFNRGTYSINGMFNVDSVFMQGTGANVNFDTDITVPYFRQASGNLQGDGEVLITRQMDWSAGTQREQGTTKIAQGAVFNIFDSGTINSADGRNFINEGSVLWSKSGTLTGNGNFYNYGTMEFKTGSFKPTSLYNYGKITVNNNGTMEFSGKTINHGIVEAISGNTLWSNSSVTSVADSGEYCVHSAAELEFGNGQRFLTDASVLSGNGNVKWSASSTLNSSALIRPDSLNQNQSAGELKLLDDFVFQENSRLSVEIGGYLPGIEHDLLTIDGNAELNGKLEIDFIDNFVPAIGDTFRVVNAAALSGEFTDLLLPQGFAADVEYLQTGVKILITQIVTSLEENIETQPLTFSLYQNFPNPFNPETTIRYDLPQAVDVKIEVFNVLGKKVAELVNAEKQSGTHKVYFNGINLSSGVYFYKINAGQFSDLRRMVLVK